MSAKFLWTILAVAMVLSTASYVACVGESETTEEDGLGDDDTDDDSGGDDDGPGYSDECDIDYGANPGCDGSDPACQNAMMINEDRQDNPDESDCAPAILWDDDLAEVARLHSKDMCDRGFFDHVNPDGDDPFDRMADGGVSFVTAGENIAYGTNGSGIVGTLEDLFMDEPECDLNHRGNILNRDFRYVGVGVHECGDGLLYLTQDFATFSASDLRDDPHEYCEG